MDTKQDRRDLDRDQQILNRLAKIEHKVDSVEQTLAFSLRADARRHFGSVKEIFGDSKRYMRTEGRKEGWLVLFDARPLSNKTPVPDLIPIGDSRIRVITIDINPQPPSRQ